MLIPVERMTMRYEHCRDPKDALRVSLRELAGSRVRYGYRRLTVLLKREGWEVNAETDLSALYEEGLIVRTQKRRERAQRQRVPSGQAVGPNQKWSMHSWRSGCRMAVGSRSFDAALGLVTGDLR